jgi:hypothetical protein
MEAENAAGGGVADGGVRIVCVSAHVQKQNPLLPLKIAEWGANQQHGQFNLLLCVRLMSVLFRSSD